MIISELDLFILNLVSNGLGTPYDLKAKAGLSVGSTSPVLGRLKSHSLIDAGKQGVRGSIRYSITEKGSNVLKRDWRIAANEQTTDIDAILRIASLASSFSTREAASQLLSRSAARLASLASTRLAEAKQTEPEIKGLSGGLTFKWLRTRCEAARLEAQAKVLMDIANSKLRVKKSVAKVSKK